MNPAAPTSPSAKAPATNAMGKKNKLSLRVKIRDQSSILKQLLAPNAPAEGDDSGCDGAGVINVRKKARPRSEEKSVVLDAVQPLEPNTLPCRRTAQEEACILRDLRQHNALYRGQENVQLAASAGGPKQKAQVPQTSVNQLRPLGLSTVNASNVLLPPSMPTPSEGQSPSQASPAVSIYNSCVLILSFCIVVWLSNTFVFMCTS
jgi:hypothetical protein